MPLLDLLASNPSAIRKLNIEQVVATAGDGRLRDLSDAQKELREYLKRTTVEQLAEYANYCMSNAFIKGGQVLQDIVNELGRRLEYDVTNGRYQGTPKEIGHDGLWHDPSGHRLVLEVKTTDTYRLALETVIGYRNELIERGFIEQPCSVLIVVGRTDTGELEAQVRGSRYAWDIRLISVDSLLSLVRVKESADSEETIAKIRRLLTPLEYTRLDALVDVVFTTAHDVETSVSVESGDQAPEVKVTSAVGQHDSKFDFTPSEVIQAIRERIVTTVAEHRKTVFVKKSRALYWSPAGDYRIVCTVSKRYASQGIMKYWYAYHPQWSAFLQGSNEAYFALGCTDIDTAFVLPEKLIRAHLADFNITERKEGGKYYHIKILQRENGEYYLELPRSSDDLALKQYEVKLITTAESTASHV